MRLGRLFFVLATTCLVAGCPAPSMPDAGDAASDVARPDAPGDARADAAPDVAPPPPDATPDATPPPPDATPDVTPPPPDASPDVTLPPPDAMIDAAADATPDAAPDVTPVDVPATDASADVPGDGATACGVPGDYSYAVMGMTVYFRFTTTMTWEGGLTASSLGTASAIPLGDWSLTGSTITLRNDPGSSVSGCSSTDVGTYTVSFGPMCRTMTWTRVSDTCTGRGTALDGAVYTRL